jgi:acetyltransferase-like isoleucine patch superfamily enzyme
MIYLLGSSNIGIDIDDSNVVHSHVVIHDKVKLGKNCKIQSFAFIPNGVEIEDDVFIGPHVCFTNDPIMDIVPQGQFTPTRTVVKRGARIGANASIRAGVTIGEGAIIGMGSAVLEDVPRCETWVGNPAHRIK